MKYERYKLSELGELKRGKSKHRPRNDEKLYGGKYPFIQTGEIKSANWKIDSFKSTYNEFGLAQSRLWEEGTLCITIAANIAETAILSFPACFPDSVIGFIPNKDKANVYYVDYVLRNYKNKLIQSASQTAQKNINLGTFEREIFLFPNIEEQNRIISKIMPYEEKIRNNECKIRCIQEYIELIFYKWFVDFNFPNKDSKPYKSCNGDFIEVEDKKIPSGWQIKSLNEIVDILTNTINPQKTPGKIYKHYSIPVFDDTNTYAEELGATILSNKYKLSDNNILVSKLNPWFKRIIYPMDVDEAICSTEFVVWQPKKNNLLEYLYVVANSEKFTKYCTNASSGTSNSHKRVSPKFMMKYKVPYNEEIVFKFNEMVKPMVKKVNLLLIENKNLKEIRDLLIKKLIK